MKIVLREITIEDLSKDYEDNDEGGVVGFGGLLDIRPPYQREFIYGIKERDAVIDTITKDFPLNVMYWAVREDGNFEVIDGQQRTISVNQYITGDFSFNGRYFHNLQTDEKEQILNYTLMVYLCSGTDSERLKWFETINIAGKTLTPQELRNAVYSGSWVTDAKKYFSKNGCPAYAIGSDYLSGVANRQEYLETAIEWINNGDVEGYMGIHQHDPTAVDLWNYFQNVINWVEATFPKKRSQMKGLPWGDIYNSHKGEMLDPKKLEDEISKLLMDDEVTKKSGVYQYVLTHDEKYLSLRAFTESQKVEAFGVQGGICPMCKKEFPIGEMHADHKVPWSKGGKTTPDNCQMLCRDDNLMKSNT